VGAPKSGTTFLHDRLREHPRIFLPWRKEPHFFGQDLRFRRERISKEHYLSLFDDAKDDQLAGEASVWYLASKTAASEIKAFSPSASIIVMLRNPVDMVRSLHQHSILIADENIRDLRKAVEAESARRTGHRIPKNSSNETALLYVEAATYAPQIRRYLDTFGSGRVHIILYDDLSTEPQTVYDQVLKFLGVEPGFVISPDRVNVAKTPKSYRIQRWLHAAPGSIRAIARLVPERQRIKLVNYLHDMNTRRASRTDMDPETRLWLGRKFESDVLETSSLIGRDLSHWLQSWQI
jgi:hypothetical protein